MKSVSAKIILWWVSALLVSLGMFLVAARVIVVDTVVQGLTRFSDFEFQQAREYYETAGAEGLSRHLAKLNASINMQYLLTDSSGRDLATGEDRSSRLRRGDKRWVERDGNVTRFGGYSPDGRYVWLGSVQSSGSMLTLAPFYALVLATVGALYWMVRVQIAGPLRRLASVVGSFGEGRLDSRAEGTRKDEIGNLGRSFNAMADRMQTLLAAERQLLQDVSHELRSPLARLTFEAEMVRRTTDRDVSAARVRREVERLSELVSTLIDMTRVEGDPSAVELTALSVNEILEDIAAGCRVEAEAKGCAISVAPYPPVVVRANEELLHRAFENVVRNAIRYSPAGSRVEIELKRTAKDVTVGVRDYGPGIPEHLIPRVFDAFFRVDSSRDEATGGLGLGLAIARRAARAHRGDITVENRSPGALFRVMLPLNGDDDQQAAPR